MKAMSWGGVLGTLRRTGPYVLVELLLPGGTLLALLLWLSNGVGRGHFADVPRGVGATCPKTLTTPFDPRNQRYACTLS